MGNANSNVSDGVKKQAEGATRKLYQLANLNGGGMLVDLTKQAINTKNYAALDEAIKTRVEPFLYNNGDGRKFHVSAIVLIRNRDRGKHKHLLKNEADFDNYQEPTDCKDPTMFREVCWRIDERGAVGESCLHVCLLNATSVHAELAKRLIGFYPKLINDIYMSDEYYGENVLHMAIVNEDPAMVKFLLDNGVNVQERCTGSFMGPEDQKASRTDNLEHEWVDRDQNTNYAGYVYWGEFPACFAACLGQEECYRLILAKGADPNSLDTNGNMVLHLQVIHEKLAMFNMAYELGADLGIKNNLNLTPLTLAAKLARKELFFHIMNIEREIYWQIGSVTCAAYPLKQLDTIDQTTGGIQKESALNLIVFGESTAHLDLIEGPVIDLLHAKWNTFVKFRFYRQFTQFFIYFLLSITAFVYRPIAKQGGTSQIPLNGTANGTFLGNVTLFKTASSLVNFTSLLGTPGNLTDVLILDDINGTVNGPNVVFVDFSPNATTLLDVSNVSQTNDSFMFGTCIPYPVEPHEYTRFVCEILILLGAVSYLLGALRECHFLGASMFLENLATAPSRVMFLISCCLVIVMSILRLLCAKEVEDLVAITVMLTTAPYFLFFCRGFKTVGPFVVMIYRMLSGDLLRFVVIYLIFVMGFSQAFYIVFLSYKKPDTPDAVDNPLGTPAESVVGMFMVSLASFDWMYNNFDKTAHEYIAKLLFVIYNAIVGILLINMLIAMMGNTYTKIAETKNEWQRQWARIVLVVERGVTPKERLARQLLYSQPMSGNARALVLRLNQSEEEKEEMKELMDIRRYHDKAIARRMAKLMGPRMSVPRPSIVGSLHPGQFNANPVAVPIH